VRRLAAEHQVDLSTIKGTGPNGRVSAEDHRQQKASDEGTGNADQDICEAAEPATSHDAGGNSTRDQAYQDP